MVSLFAIPGAYMFASNDVWENVYFPLDNSFLYCEERSLGCVTINNCKINYIICDINYDHSVSGVIDNFLIKQKNLKWFIIV